MLIKPRKVQAAESDSVFLRSCFVKLLPNDVFGKRWGKKNEKDGHDFLEKKG